MELRNDEIIACLRAKNSALRARVEKLEKELADAIEVNTAAYMLGVDSGKKDYALLVEGRMEKLERVKQLAKEYRLAETDPEMNSLDVGMCARRLDAALAKCEEVNRG